MPRLVGKTKMVSDTDRRCQTCDAPTGSNDEPVGDYSTSSRKHRTCPDCHGRVALCTSCNTWLALSRFNALSSAQCARCVTENRRDRAWTKEDSKRLYEAGRGVLNLWPRYVKLWTPEDLEAWRAFLGAMERLPRNEA